MLSQIDKSHASDGPPALIRAADMLIEQLESDSTSEEQLEFRASDIYLELVVIEKKYEEVCELIAFGKMLEVFEEFYDEEVHDEPPEYKTDSLKGHWQNLLGEYQILLHMYYEFFLVSQHPSVRQALKDTAKRFEMLARMWKYGIRPFLKLEPPRDYLFRFIDFAYPRFLVLKDRVSVYRNNLIECLGDLARVRMAAEESHRDRDAWARLSRKWYTQIAGPSPEVGRVQHHLGVLAQPDRLQQLFFYTKALVSVDPFHEAQDTIEICFALSDENEDPIATAFIMTHRALLMHASQADFTNIGNNFLSILRRQIRQSGVESQQAIYIVSCNIASILGYGDPDETIALECFKQCGRASAVEAHTSALKLLSGEERIGEHVDDAGVAIQSEVVYRGSSLTFHTLCVLLDQLDNPDVYPCLHLSMSFIWCMAFHPPAMQQLERCIPWIRITTWLNQLLQSDSVMSTIDSPAFLGFDNEPTQALWEDSVIRGLSWSRLYHSDKFFNGLSLETDREFIETPSVVTLRINRCLWLGVRIATVRNIRIFGVMIYPFMRRGY